MAVERMDSRKFFGVVVDDNNKVHYYNCKPVGQKKSAARPLPKSIRFIASLFGYKARSNNGSMASIPSASAKN